MKHIRSSFFAVIFIFCSLILPVTTFAFDYCEGHNAQGYVQGGTCIYAKDFGYQPNCGKDAQTVLNDPNGSYTALPQDDITKCQPNIGKSYVCCVNNKAPALAGAECDGHVSGDTTVQRGSCIYYLTSGNPPYTTNDNVSNLCTDQNQCKQVDCKTLGQAVFGNSQYHGIDDSVKNCPVSFTGSIGGIYQCCAPDVQPSPAYPPPPCVAGKDKTTCASVDTGIGSLSVDPASLVGTVVGILLGISGGIATVIIILSGYRIIFSRGDPEKLQAARESITSAIIGLLFIIFSVVILRVIGVDILHIPGLNP